MNYSNKDMTGWDLSDRTDMDNLTITGLCLSQETPKSQVLPPKLQGVTFVNCNLDNVFIPEGNTLVDCSNKSFKAQNDGEDWLIDEKTKKPIEPLEKEKFMLLGVSIASKDIPKKKLEGNYVSRKADASLLIEVAVAEMVSEAKDGLN